MSDTRNRGAWHLPKRAVRSAKRVTLSAVAGVALFTASAPVYAITIDPFYDAGVSNQIIDAFENVVGVYDTMFTDLITVNLTVSTSASITTALASTQPTFTATTYGEWRDHLASHATTPNDLTAIQFLPTAQPIGPGDTGLDPGNNGKPILLTWANARAIGLEQGVSPVIDAALIFYDSPGQLDTHGCHSPQVAAQTGDYNFCNVAAHELDHALGILSMLDNIRNNYPTDSNYIAPEDFFRFSPTASGSERSYTTNPNAAAYFSIVNGMSLFPQFNQDVPAGNPRDRSGWIYGNNCSADFVQNAVQCLNEPNAYGPLSPEAAVLDVLGYDPLRQLVIPEPASMTLLGFGVIGLGAIRRRRRAYNV